MTIGDFREFLNENIDLDDDTELVFLDGAVTLCEHGSIHIIPVTKPIAFVAKSEDRSGDIALFSVQYTMLAEHNDMCEDEVGELSRMKISETGIVNMPDEDEDEDDMEEADV